MFPNSPYIYFERHDVTLIRKIQFKDFTDKLFLTIRLEKSVMLHGNSPSQTLLTGV
jgi:hypothetical protein